MRGKPDRVLIVTKDRRGRMWTFSRAPEMTGMGHAKKMGHTLLYKINVYSKSVA